MGDSQGVPMGYPDPSLPGSGSLWVGYGLEFCNHGLTHDLGYLPATTSEYNGEPKWSRASVPVGVRGGDTVCCLGVNDENESRDGATVARQSLGAVRWRAERCSGTAFGEITSNLSSPGIQDHGSGYPSRVLYPFLAWVGYGLGYQTQGNPGGPVWVPPPNNYVSFSCNYVQIMQYTCF